MSYPLMPSSLPEHLRPTWEHLWHLLCGGVAHNRKSIAETLTVLVDR